MGFTTFNIDKAIAYLMGDYDKHHPKGKTRTGKRKHIDKSHKQKLRELDVMLTW